MWYNNGDESCPVLVFMVALFTVTAGASGYVVGWYWQQCSEAYSICSRVLEEHCLIESRNAFKERQRSYSFYSKYVVSKSSSSNTGEGSGPTSIAETTSCLPTATHPFFLSYRTQNSAGRGISTNKQLHSEGSLMARCGHVLTIEKWVITALSLLQKSFLSVLLTTNQR